MMKKPSMGPTPTTPRPTPTRTRSGLTVRVPAWWHEECPRCRAVNDDKKESVWRVSDERGLHLECDVCAHAWR